MSAELQQSSGSGRETGRVRFALAVIILVAFALRIFRLGAQSLWYDEGVTAWLARLPLAQQAAWTANDIQPPLYYAVVTFWGAWPAGAKQACAFLLSSSAFCACR